MFSEFYNNKKPLFWTLVSLFILVPIAIFVGYTIYTSIYSSILVFEAAPNFITATLEPDGANLSLGENRLKPGTYTLTISAEGFHTKTQDITAVAEESQNLVIALDPTAENSNFYTEHAEEYTEILQTLADKDFDESKTSDEKQNPIGNILPYIDPGIFRVDSTTSGTELTLVVSIFTSVDEDPTFTETNRQAFLDWLANYRTTYGDTKEYPIEYHYW